jgi:hypothetical protein
MKTPASPGVDAVYCGQPVKYYIKKDDDGNKIRTYDSLCEFHRERVDEMTDEEVDE